MRCPGRAADLRRGYEPTRKSESPVGRAAEDARDEPGLARGRGFFGGDRRVALTVLERILQQTRLEDIFWVLLLLVLCFVGLMVIIRVLFRVTMLIDRWVDSPKAGAYAFMTIIALVMIVGIVLLVRYAKHYSLPLYPVYLLLSALFMMGWAVFLVLSPKMKKIVTAHVRKPPGVVRWVDLYASDDPVPNGPTSTKVAKVPESIKIWNLGSRLADHTAWRNRDGFVLRVAKLCAETAESPWSDALPPEPGFVEGLVDFRAAWRGGFLWKARLVTVLTWVVVGVILWTQYQASIPVPFDLPGWVPAAPVRPVLLVTFIASAMWVTSSVLRWLCNWWVRAEQEEVLAHNPPGSDRQVYAVTLMGIVLGMQIAASYILMRPSWLAELDPFLTIGHWLKSYGDPPVQFVIYSFYFGLFWYILFRHRLKHPPKASGPPDRGLVP